MKTRRTPFLMAVLTAISVTLIQTSGVPENNTVDFRYSPPWWQTAICLPDDPDKILVGKEGQLLFDYGRGSERAKRFGLYIQPDVTNDSIWKHQQILSPRIPIIITRDRKSVV